MQPRKPADAIDVTPRDGIQIDAPGIEGIDLDGSDPAAPTNVVSHAHADHLFTKSHDSPVVCSDLTAALAAARLGTDEIVPQETDAVELLPAGHIAGSRAAHIRTPAGTVLYTGDISTRDRFYLEGFRPPEADILIIESTYGDPTYTLPPVDAVERAALEWLDEHHDRPAILYGYALGKAQKIQRLLARSDRDRVFVTDAILQMNDRITEALDVSFDVAEFDTDAELGPGDAVVFPSSLRRFEWVTRLVEEQDAVTAGFSGWAHDSSFIYRRNLDAGFELSDHCDFPELVAVVEAVDPEKVYTTHGFTSTLASELTRRGYKAQALIKNQTTLGDF